MSTPKRAKIIPAVEHAAKTRRQSFDHQSPLIAVPTKAVRDAGKVAEKPRPVVLNYTRALVMSMRTDRF